MKNKNYDFNWELNLDKIIEEDKERAREIIENITDVYEENNDLMIEYTYSCKEYNSDECLRRMRIPLKKKLENIKCAKHDQYGCSSHTCMIVVAAYLLYLDRKNNFYKNVLDDVDVWADETEIEEKNATIDWMEKSIDIYMSVYGCF